MKRNYIYTLCGMSLLLLAACTDETELENDGRQIVISASLPTEQATTPSSSSSGPRRVGLSQKDGSLDLIAQWREDDKINLFVKQNKKAYSIAPTKVYNISSDGKKCSFGFKLPSSIDAEKAYTVYGLCDIEGMVIDDADDVVAAKSELRRTWWNKTNAFAPVWFQATGGPMSIKANFQHLGTYEILHVKNTSKVGVMFQHCGFEVDTPWFKYYDSTHLDENYDPTKYVCEPSDAESASAFIGAGATGQYLSWYIPSGAKISNAKLVAKIEGKTVISSNTKSSNVTIQRGHAYHMYATWDGKELRFEKGNDDEHGSAPETETITIPGTNVSFKMIAVEGGTFWMGATDDDTEADSEERPRHQVSLSSFAIGQTEVTQELWETVMGSNPSYFKGANRPVEEVSWDDCQTFISKLNALTGRTFRLPTEAEWEYAARGGKYSKGYKYAGSNDIDAVAWYNNNGGRCTHPVAEKLANELGLYDMTGNAWEWCQDLYSSSYYESSPTYNPCNTTVGAAREHRGGSWFDPTKHCRVTNRYNDHTAIKNNNLGLRLALSDSESYEYEAKIGDVNYGLLEDALNAAEEGQTIRLLKDKKNVSFSKCITLDLNGHSVDLLYIQNQSGIVTIKDGIVNSEIDGKSGDDVAYLGTVILENLIVKNNVWSDGHTCYIISGTYGHVNNHKTAGMAGSVYISGANTFIGGINDQGNWQYVNGVILNGGVYKQDPIQYRYVELGDNKTVTVLDKAPENAPSMEYVYKIVDL